VRPSWDHAPHTTYEDNTFTRTLANKNGNHNYIHGTNDAAIAKDTLSRNFFMGMHESLEASLGWFETFFGWNHGTDSVNPAHDSCRRDVVVRGRKRHYNINEVVPPDGSPARMSLAKNYALESCTALLDSCI
jgi:hypothetical protein